MSDRLPCPHCESMMTDLCDFDWSTREEIITECETCGNDVLIYRRVDVTYELAPVKRTAESNGNIHQEGTTDK